MVKPETDGIPTTTWHPQLDNPDFLGWLVVAAYLIAAISCGCVALKTDRLVSEGSTKYGG